MTVKTLMKFVACPVEIRSGRKYLFAKISPKNISNHLGEEVTEIQTRGNTLVIYCEVPDYELDVDVDVDLFGADLPWD